MENILSVEVLAFDNRTDLICLNVTIEDEDGFERTEVEAVETLQLQSRLLDLLGIQRLISADRISGKDKTTRR